VRLNGNYRGFSQCIIGDGVTICFWEDRRTEIVLAITYPRLASFALNHAASVKDILEADELVSIFILPLPQEALQEFGQFQDSLHDLELNENTSDQWKPDCGEILHCEKILHSYL
jgi:hypothetical protein